MEDDMKYTESAIPLFEKMKMMEDACIQAKSTGKPNAKHAEKSIRQDFLLSIECIEKVLQVESEQAEFFQANAEFFQYILSSCLYKLQMVLCIRRVTV